MNAEGVMGFDQVTLERVPVAIRKMLSPSVLHSAKLTSWPDMMTETLVMELRAYVLAEHLDRHTVNQSKTVEVKVPDGWREQWKQDHQDAAGWAIRWLASRRGVRTRSVSREVHFSATWDQYAAFPEASIVADDRLGAPVRWLMSSTDIRQ